MDEQTFNALSPLMVTEIKQLLAAELDARASEAAPEADEHKRRLALINVKEYLTAREAALLLGCSDSHLRNLVREAKRGRKRYPVPYRDLDGVVTFPRVELLKWAETPKPKLRAA